MMPWVWRVVAGMILCWGAPACRSAQYGIGWQGDSAYRLHVHGRSRLGRDRVESEAAACADARAMENREFSTDIVGQQFALTCPPDAETYPQCTWEFRLDPGNFSFAGKEISRKITATKSEIYCEVLVKFSD